MNDIEASWEDCYLPERYFSHIEQQLSSRPSYRHPIFSIEDVKENPKLQVWGISAFSCIRNFEKELKNPIYFAISQAPIPSAMICKFDDYQCVIITSCLSENITRLAAVLLTDNSLLDFLLKSSEPLDPTGTACCTRKEAVYNCVTNEMAIQTRIWEIASCIANYSSYFIVAHELAHIFLGHMEQSKEMSMVELEAHDAPPGILSRANEWQRTPLQ